MPGLNIAIDLGTSSVTAFVQGKGIVFSESTAICYDAYDDEIVCVGNSAGEMFENLVGISPDDVVIAFSFPRYSSATLKAAQYCREIGATVIGITNSTLSPLAQNSDYVLIAKSDMVSLVDSLVAPFSVVNALLVALASAREKEVQKSLETLERVWEEYNIYEKRVDNS